MKLQLHPEAEARFNVLAENVLAMVEEVPPESRKTPRSRFEADRFVSGNLTEKNLQSVTHLGTFDAYSREVVELLFHPKPGKRAFRLSADGCKHFENLTTRVAAVNPFRNISTRSRVRTVAIKWLSARLGGSTAEPFVAYLLTSITPTIRKFTAIVPIAYLVVEHEIPFGRVVFKPMDAAFFEGIVRQREPIGDNKQKSIFDANILEYRKKMQGYAGAFVKIEGDPEYVELHSIEEASHAVAMLRFFSVEIQLPEACSYMAPFDLRPPPSRDVWLQEPGQEFPTSHLLSMPLPPPKPLQLDRETLSKLRKEFPFDDLSHLAQGDGLSPFEKSLKESILLSSKAAASSSPAEKLVFILVALESILLRNPTEPIQQTVGDRFGFLLSKVPAERQELAKLFKSCYELRSSFVHHGRDPGDLELLREFLAMSWVLLVRLLRNRKVFMSKDDLLNHLDSLKYA